MVIRRVGPLSCAKVAGLLYLIMGLIFGAFVSLFAMAGLFASDTQRPFAGLLFGAGAVVILPICYGVLGFITTLVMAALFNVIAGITGGIEVDAS